MALATLAQLAELVGGRVVGDATTQIENALPLQDASGRCLTMADHAKHHAKVADCEAAAVLVTEEFADCPKPQLVVNDLHEAFATIILSFRPARTRHAAGIHASAVIDASATLGEGTTVGPGSTIGPDCQIGKGCTIHAGVHIAAGCVLGDGCELFPNVVIYEETRIGSRVLIHSCAVIGAYGFGYKNRGGQHERCSQLGWVQIGDDVEIGANSTIDRGTYGATKIGDGTKLDNLVQIGHNCHIGARNLLCAQVGIAGSSSTGDNCVVGGQVGMADHVHLANNVMVGGKSGVMSNIKEGEIVFGCPAIPSKQKMYEVALVGKLPEFRKDIKQLQKDLAALLDSETSSRKRNAA